MLCLAAVAFLTRAAKFERGNRLLSLRTMSKTLGFYLWYSPVRKHNVDMLPLKQQLCMGNIITFTYLK